MTEDILDEIIGYRKCLQGDHDMQEVVSPTRPLIGRHYKCIRENCGKKYVSYSRSDDFVRNILLEAVAAFAAQEETAKTSGS